MGRMIRLTCDDCGNSYDLKIGQGMLDSDPSVRYMIGYCSSCRSYVSVPTYHDFDKDSEKITAGTCKCGHVAVLTDDSDTKAMEALKCPECNSVLRCEITGMWD